jgi:hypothetical protein
MWKTYSRLYWGIYCEYFFGDDFCVERMKPIHSVILAATFGLGSGYLAYRRGCKEKSEKRDGSEDGGGRTEIRQGSGGQVVRCGGMEIVQNSGGQVIRNRQRGRKRGVGYDIFHGVLCGLLAGTSVLAFLRFGKAEEGEDLFWSVVFGTSALYVGVSYDDDYDDDDEFYCGVGIPAFCIIV